jgi:hypothetical protein
MNQLLLIAFDLRHPAMNTEAVIARIRAFGQWARVNSTTYLVYAPNAPAQIRAYMMPVLNIGDRLFVTELGFTSAWGGYPEVFDNWMQAHSEP